MERETGKRTSPIWLLADSEPSKWRDDLKGPLDPRHPARHNIWTPVLEVIQDELFNSFKNHIESSNIYIRNSVDDPGLKPPSNNQDWDNVLAKELDKFKDILNEYKPCIILSFGAFAFEFARRSLDETPLYKYRHWTTKLLGLEFRQRTSRFNYRKSNLIPLLHVSIARGKFLQAHAHFCGKDSDNYFEFAGKRLVPVIFDCSKAYHIWV